MSEEVNELLDKLGKLEDAPLIWVNKKVYDTSKEVEKLKKQLQQKESIIKEVREYVENENIDVCTIRYNDIQDVKKELLEILDKVGDEK